MKHWKETEHILARAGDLVSAGRAAAIATVVRIEGSAYRRPGAKFLIEDDGRTLGGVSGGCLEADVRETARRHVIPTGAPRLLHYDTGTDDRVWGLGLGCNGAVDVFVQPIDRIARALPMLREMLRGDSPFSVSTVVSGPAIGDALVLSADTESFPDTPGHIDVAAARRRLATGESGVDVADGLLVFTDVLWPPPHLVVCGAGDDARPLVAYAAAAGFQVTVVDHRPVYLTADRFPDARRLLQLRPDDYGGAFLAGSRTSVILMNHSLALDREWLRRLLPTGAGYIGLLGPRTRTEEILGQIGVEHDDRGVGPVGLDVGADGPEQIAISVVAELLAVRARRDARHLRERGISIHAD
jgi:xanthine dehydrogenase accessory factor